MGKWLNEADKDLAVKVNWGWDLSDMCVYAFNERLKLTPEFLWDLESYYGVTQSELFTWLLENKGRFPDSRDLDIAVTILPALKKSKESIIKMEVFSSGNPICNTFFSSAPLSAHKED